MSVTAYLMLGVISKPRSKHIVFLACSGLLPLQSSLLPVCISKRFEWHTLKPASALKCLSGRDLGDVV